MSPAQLALILPLYALLMVTLPSKAEMRMMTAELAAGNPAILQLAGHQAVSPIVLGALTVSKQSGMYRPSDICLCMMRLHVRRCSSAPEDGEASAHEVAVH